MMRYPGHRHILCIILSSHGSAPELKVIRCLRPAWQRDISAD